MVARYTRAEGLKILRSVGEHALFDYSYLGKKLGDFPDYESLAWRFRMVDCDPLNLPSLLGADQVELPNRWTEVEVNDPNVYQAATGDWVLLLNCAAAGGLLRFKATPDNACYREPEC